jgi:lysyl-tRNA synthetase class 2
VYVFGQRVHEVALGLGLLALAGIALALGILRLSDEALMLVGPAVWLVVKDWRDLFPRWRNTQVHRRFGCHLHAEPRLRRRLDLPTVSAVAALAVAAVNAVSALTPNVGWRGHLLLRVEPVAALPIFHAVAIPASVALGLTAASLYRRRRRAMQLAIVVLALLAVVDVLKGLDVEEAVLSAGLAATLWYGRATFDVEHEPLGARRAVLPVYVCGLAVVAAGVASVWVALGLGGSGTDPRVELFGREAGALLAWQPVPLPLVDGASLLVRGLMLIALVTAASMFFRPRSPVVVTGRHERGRARDLVREHGRDTLAAFKLRGDLDYLFASDGRAFVGYRVEHGVLLVAGDPVGPDDAMPAMIDTTCAFADAHGLRIGGVGASAAMVPRWREAGLRSLYIGDEAIVDTGAFSLDGRPIRKVRQSVKRLGSAGFTASVEAVGQLGDAALAELEDISTRWRAGEPERGFAMSIDRIGDGLVVVGRDGDGAAKGWIHFLPTYGRPAMSLALMRRDRDTPNGLMEFLVVRSIELLRERGIEEISLNFSAFARSLRNPAGLLDRLLGRLLGIASRWFQIESLYRFNAKFFPRWEPRYLVYPGSTALPAIGLATLVVEGQLPRSLTHLLGSGATA